MSNYGRASNVTGVVNIQTQWNIHQLDHTRAVEGITDNQKKGQNPSLKACLQSLVFPEIRQRSNDIANAVINTCN